MRLAVTVGFDADLVVRALANINASEVFLLRGVTGSEGDAKSEATVRDVVRALKRGVDYPVDLRDLTLGLRQIFQLSYDAVALAGGPRLLVILAFVASALKKARIYVVPEFSATPVDVTALSHVADIGGLTKARLRVLAALTRESDADELAEALGLDSSTVYRHLSELEERGLVKASGSRRKRYSADPLAVALASMYLNSAGELNE